MIGSGLARRYVQALFNIAQEKDILEKVQEDLKALSELLNNLPEVFSFLFDPSIGRTAKKGALKEIFKDASEFTLNFYFLIIDKNRIEILVDVYRIFDELCNSLKGIITGTIHSAVALDNKLSYE
nr:ATP synthase F1 subunit delta [Bacteroidota bacterium]